MINVMGGLHGGCVRLTLLQGLAPLLRHHSSHEDQLHFWSSGVPVMFLSTMVVVHLLGSELIVE